MPNNLREPITASTSNLRDALLGSYPATNYYGAPVVGINRGDETAAAWTWLLGLVRRRSDWRPAIGTALQHATRDGGDYARIALADFLESFQESVALLKWTEPMAKVWPDVVATCRGTTFGRDDYRLATILAAQRNLWDLCQADSCIGVDGIAADGSWLIADVREQAAFESVLATSARVGKFGPRGEGPWYWLGKNLILRDWLEPMLVLACTKFASAGCDAEVRAMLDWFADDHDLWRYIDLLESWTHATPRWWNEPADVVPVGWRFPVRADGAKTLGEVALGALARARAQVAATMTIDLPTLDSQLLWRDA